jgi:hypothetical protein
MMPPNPMEIMPSLMALRNSSFQHFGGPLCALQLAVGTKIKNA